MRTRSHLPDLILLDVEMPTESGHEVWRYSLHYFKRHIEFCSQVCQKIRKLYPEGLPIIMLSGNDDEANILKGLQVCMIL